MKYADIRDWLTHNSALQPTLLAGAAFEHLVEGQLRRNRISRTAEYLEFLRQRPDAVEQLVAGIAVPETWFFRYPKSFEVLAHHLTTHWNRGSDCGEIRMLSIACAAGEEACSMAITAIYAGWPSQRVVVEAIDINRHMIGKAQRGVYGPGTLRTGRPDWARAWLSTSDDEVHVAPEARATINYRHDDILKVENLASLQRYDVVFCRNLLIYLNEDSRRRLVRRLADWLSPNGVLFVGHAEQSAVFAGMFEPLPAPHAFALRHVQVDPVTEASAHPRQPQRTESGTGEDIAHTAREAPSPTSVKSTAPVRPMSLEEARVLADRGELEKALHATKAVLATNRSNVGALELLGSVHLALGEKSEACACFRKVVYLKPDHERSLLHLALMSEQAGDADQALRYRRRAERAHQGNTVGDGINNEP